MVKYKTFFNYIGREEECKKHDESIKLFIEKLSTEGHTIISVNTIGLGSSLSYARTEILFRENITRKVITEKEA